MKKIKHKHTLSINLSIQEDGDLEDIDHIEVEVTQYSMDDDEEKNCVAKIQLSRIMKNDDGKEIDFIDLADSQDEAIHEAAILMFSHENNSAVSKLVKTDHMDFMESFIYIDKMVVPKEFDLSSIAPAISMTLKKLNRGIDPSTWLCGAYNERTFFDSSENELNSETINKIFKDLGFKEISKKEERSVGIDTNNTVLVVGGLTLNKNLDFDPTYSIKNEINKMIDVTIEKMPDVKKFREGLNMSVNKPVKKNNGQ